MIIQRMFACEIAGRNSVRRLADGCAGALCQGAFSDHPIVSVKKILCMPARMRDGVTVWCRFRNT